MTSGVVLITGGSRGLGRSAAIHLAKAGHDIIITYLTNAAEAQKVVKEIHQMDRKARAMQLDVAQSKTFKPFAGALAKVLKTDFEVQTLYALVNNAGVGVHASFQETTEEQFDQMVNVHLKSTFFLTQTLLPLMSDGGKILNVSSGLARFSLPGYAAYASMKGGIEVLTRYMAKELGPRRISVNTIAPGAIETDFGGGMVRDNKDVNQGIASGTALGRVGLPDDVGGAIAALISEQTGWINAQRIEVAGGVYI